MKNDAFERFRKTFDNKLHERGGRMMLNTSFLTDIKSDILCGLSESFDILDFIERYESKDNLFIHKTNVMITYDEFINEVCKECERNVWFFIRLFMPKVMKKCNIIYRPELNFGIVSLIYYYDHKMSCILCNPRQTLQTFILSFLYTYSDLFKSNSVDLIKFGKKSGTFELVSENIIESIPDAMMKCISKRNKRNPIYSHDKDLYVFCDDFEFLDFKDIIFNALKEERHVSLFGCGVVNKNLNHADIKYINDHTKLIHNDYELIIPSTESQNESEYTGLHTPICRVFFDTNDFFDENDINRFRCLFGNDEETLQSEIFRVRPKKREKIKVTIEETLCKTIEVDVPDGISDDDAIDYVQLSIIDNYKNGSMVLSEADKKTVQIHTEYKNISTNWCEFIE